MSEKIVTIGDEEFLVSVESRGSRHTITRSDRTDTIDIVRFADHEAELLVNGRRELVPYVIVGETIHFSYRGTAFSATVSQHAHGKKPRHREHSLSAPMPGVVLKIFASAGDVVAKGMPLLILEAMKMEHPITAPYDGVVKAIHCSAGQLVQPGFDLIELTET